LERHPETRREETDAERADRNLQELIGELRVALPGVQVLFAFLLVVPFNNRFATVTDFQQNLYFATLLCSAAATALLIAPSVHHRISFRQQDKEHLVVEGNRLAIGGLAFLALAMTGAVLLVTDFLFGNTTTVITGVVVGLLYAVLWYALPIGRRLGARESDPG
jgi:Family of unknown function (DUF6328)